MNHQDHLATVLDRFEFDKRGIAYVPARDLTPASFYEYHMRGTGKERAISYLRIHKFRVINRT